VDHRRASSFAEGLAEHRRHHRPGRVRATEPLSWNGRRMLAAAGVEVVRSDQMLCHHADFAAWAGGQRRLRMEDFNRWRRKATGYLMDGDEPAGGRWNFDAENRRPPPKGGAFWPAPVRSRLDALDGEVLASLPDGTFGDEPVGLWATSRRGRWPGCGTSWRRCCPASVPIRTPCSTATGTWPTAC
jgi:deoxyribodipyrimidine photolyase-related protein